MSAQATEDVENGIDATRKIGINDQRVPSNGEPVIDGVTGETVPGTDTGYVKDVINPHIGGIVFTLICEKHNIGCVWADTLRSEMFVPVNKWENDKVEGQSYVQIRYDSRGM